MAYNYKYVIQRETRAKEEFMKYDEIFTVVAASSFASAVFASAGHTLWIKAQERPLVFVMIFLILFCHLARLITKKVRAAIYGRKTLRKTVSTPCAKETTN